MKFRYTFYLDAALADQDNQTCCPNGIESNN